MPYLEKVCNTNEEVNRGGERGGKWGAEESGIGLSSLKSFFQNEFIFFKDLMDEIATIVSEVSEG